MVFLTKYILVGVGQCTTHASSLPKHPPKHLLWIDIWTFETYHPKKTPQLRRYDWMSRLWVKDVKVSTCIHNSKVTDFFLNDRLLIASRLIYLHFGWFGSMYHIQIHPMSKNLFNNSKVIGITSRVSFSVSMSDTSTHEVVALRCGIGHRALLAGSVLEVLLMATR